MTTTSPSNTGQTAWSLTMGELDRKGRHIDATSYIDANSSHIFNTTSHSRLNSTTADNMNIYVDDGFHTPHDDVCPLPTPSSSDEPSQYTLSLRRKRKILRKRKHVSNLGSTAKKNRDQSLIPWLSRVELLAQCKSDKQRQKNLALQEHGSNANLKSLKEVEASIAAASSTLVDSNKRKTSVQDAASAVGEKAGDGTSTSWSTATPRKEDIVHGSTSLSRTFSSSSNEPCKSCTDNTSEIGIGTIIRTIIATEYYPRGPHGSVHPDDEAYVFPSLNYTSNKPGPFMFRKRRCWIVVGCYERHMACVPITSFSNGGVSRKAESIAIGYKHDGTPNDVKVASGCSKCSLSPRIGSYVKVCEVANVEYNSGYKIMGRLNQKSTGVLMEFKGKLDEKAIEY
jgi:hypothetical protein